MTTATRTRGQHRRPTTRASLASRRTSLRVAATTVLAVLLAAVAGGAAAADQASASALDVVATRTGIVGRTACTTADVQVEAASASATADATLLGLSAADVTSCSGQDVDVTLYDATQELGTAHATLTAADPVLTFSTTVDPDAVTRVRVLVGGFALPATWQVPEPVGPPEDSCRVVNADGTASSVPCTVASVGNYAWWGTPGSGYGQAMVQFSAPEMTSDQHVEFTVTVPDEEVPDWWTWDGAGVTQVSNMAEITSRCADLPTVSARLVSNLGTQPQTFLQFEENASAPICQP